MDIRCKIKSEILPIIEASLAAGHRVFVLRPNDLNSSHAAFAYTCLNMDGSFAVISGTEFDGPMLAAPIAPDSRYGSSVLVDFDGTTEHAVQALRGIFESDGVVVRFMKDNSAPVVLNYGSRVLDRFPGGPGCFLELTPELLAPAMEQASGDTPDSSALSTTPAAASTPESEKELSHV